MSSTVIIHRPSLASKSLIATATANSCGGHINPLLIEMSNKDQLTKAEAHWFKHECAELLVDNLPA